MTIKTKKNKYIDFINQIGMELFETTDPDKFFDIFLKTVKNSTGLEMAVIYVHNPATGKLGIVKSRGVPSDILDVVNQLLPNEGVTGKSFSKSVSLFYSKASANNPVISIVKDKVGTLISVPVKFMKTTIGVLAVASRKTISAERIDIPFLENITKYIAGMLEYVRQNWELTTAIQKLSYNKNIIENIIKNLPSGIIYMDNQGKILLFNPEMEQITGIKAPEVINKPVDEFIKLINFSGFNYKDVIKHKMIKKRADSFVILPDSKMIYLGYTIAPVTDTNNNIEGAIAIFADLTQVKKLEEEKRQLAHLAIIGEMSTRLAHEIKNPLSSIIIGTQLLKKRYKDAKNIQYIDMIISEIQRIDDLVMDLLAYSKKAIPHMIPVDIPAAIKNVIDVMSPRLKNYNIKVEQHIPKGTALEAISDEAALHQALINIVNNAADAMTNGGTLSITVNSVNSSVRFKTAANGKYKYLHQELIKIDIRDTGHGIDKIYLDKVFSPFFSTKIHGTGLGLSIVKNIMEMNMAKITFDSVKNKGTTFTLLFLKGRRKKCYDVLNCPADEREKCEVYLNGDTYRCFKYKNFLTGCYKQKSCIECDVYRNGVITE